MAGDWIKMRTDLYRDPKVSVMADLLMSLDGDLARFVDQHCQRQMTVTRNVMRNVTVGALVSVWGVMRLRGKRENDDLVCRGVTSAVLDDIADLPGFGSAMEAVGWAIETGESLVLPRFFEDQNVDPEDAAKKKNAERQARFRERNKANSDVTGDVISNVTVTPREEKRREEKKEPIEASGITKSVAARGSRLPKDWIPNDDEIMFCKQERPDLNWRDVANQFRDYWVAKAGKDAAKTDWPATWRNWVRRQQAPRNAPTKSYGDKQAETFAAFTGGSATNEHRNDNRTIDV